MAFEELAELERELRTCPKCQTRQKLNEIWIQKRVWGGKHSEGNTRFLCAACDEDWRRWAVANGIPSTATSLEGYAKAFERFLGEPIGPIGIAGIIGHPSKITDYREAVEKFLRESRSKRNQQAFDSLLAETPPHRLEAAVKAFYFRRAWDEFLRVSPESLTTVQRAIRILKELGGLRIQIAIEEQRYTGRFRSRSRRLDDLLPIWQTTLAKIAEDIFPDKEKGDWLKLLLSQVAEVKRLKRALEKEIAKQVGYFPVCYSGTAHIPGIGPWMTGFFIGAIGDPRRFAKSANLLGHAGTRISMEDSISIAEPRTKGKSLGSDPLLKIATVVLLPKAIEYQKTRFPRSAYSVLMRSVKKKEQSKARNAKPERCHIRGCRETDIVNLGFETRTHPKTEEKIEIFLGFCCRKTWEAHQRNPRIKAHKFFTPGHVERRTLREVGKKTVTDVFYHLWLHFLGENPRIQQNPRIMWVLRRAASQP